MHWPERLSDGTAKVIINGFEGFTVATILIWQIGCAKVAVANMANMPIASMNEEIKRFITKLWGGKWFFNEL